MGRNIANRTAKTSFARKYARSLMICAECAHSAVCAPYKHHYDECVERVTRQEEAGDDFKGPKEDCVEECKCTIAIAIAMPIPVGRQSIVADRSILPMSKLWLT